MIRRLLLLVPLFAVVALPAAPAWATVAPPIGIRWSGERAPARAGVETVGRIELCNVPLPVRPVAAPPAPAP